MNMNKKEYKFPVCPKCGSRTVVARIRKDDFYCRRCGHIGKRKEFFKNEKEK